MKAAIYGGGKNTLVGICILLMLIPMTCGLHD